MALKPVKHHNSISNSQIVIVVVVIIIIAYLLLQISTVPTVSSNSTITLALNSSYNFKMPDNSNVTAIFLASSSSSGATLYISQLPVLERDLFVLNLQKSATANISTLSTSSADLQISFVSGTSNKTVLSLAYIPKNLNIRAATLQALNSTSFGHGGSTTTIATTQTTTVTQQSTLTTTVVAANQIQQAIIDANQSSIGTLVVNYNKLYIKAASQCTSSNYNNTYSLKHGSTPKGPNTYANVTVAVPTSIFAKATKVSPSTYDVNYTAVIQIGNLPAVNLQINTTSKFVASYTITGIFQGQTYSTLLQSYQALNQSSNPCSPYV